MRNRLSRRSGKLIQAKNLTDENVVLYDLIAVNSHKNEIIQIGQVSSIDEAKKMKEQHRQDGFRYYILENNSVLEEIV